MVKHMCGLCGKTFGRKWNLIVHLNNIHDVGIEEKTISCVACGYQTPDKRKFIRHMKRQHPSTAINRTAYKLISSKKPAIYECKICKRSVQRKNFKAHQLKVHNLKNGTENIITDGVETVLVEGDPSETLEQAPVLWIKTENEECEDEDNSESTAENEEYVKENDIPPISTGNEVSPLDNSETKSDEEEGSEEPGPSGKKLSCAFCSKVFRNLSSLKKHHFISHKFLDKPARKRSCSLCHFCPVRNTVYEMLRHFKCAHNIEPETIKLHFKSVSDFFTWKLKEESETCVKFGGRRKFGRRDTVTFACNRSGYCVSKSVGKRKLQKGFSSIKINGYCPANIRATRNPNGTVVVEYQKIHVGHAKDYKQVFLSETERRKLANNLASNNTPSNHVWLDVRGPLYFDDLIQEHLSSKEILRNKQKSINVCAESKKYDPVGIAEQVNEIKKSKDLAFLYYKKPDSSDDLSQFDDGDLVLFFMFKCQKEMFQKYCHNIVCFDCANNANAHNIQMYTLMVSDDTYSSYPCVFLFSSRHDEYVFRFFFQKIKDNMGIEITPNVFMSDVENCYHTAWCTIMATFPKRELLCVWRVLESWRVFIAENVRTKQKRKEAFKTLETIMFAENKETFKTLLDDLYVSWNADSELQEVYNHFVDSYCRILPVELWAHCHRINSDFSCHMDTKNYNYILKLFHLFGSKSAMLDKTLVAILRFMGSEMPNMLMKMNQTLVVAKTYGLKNHHRNCFRMNLKDVQENDDGWNVISPNNETFYVKKIDTCGECTLPCTHCESCFHEYSCSCQEHNLKLQMCAHIHLVCRSLISKKAPELPAPELIAPAESLIEEMEVECRLNSFIEEDYSNKRISENKTQQPAVVEAPDVGSPPVDKLKEEFNKIVSKSVTTDFEAQYVKRLLSCMEASLSSMKKQKEIKSGDLHRYLVATLNYSKNPVVPVPKVQNKLIVSQNHNLPCSNMSSDNNIISLLPTTNTVNNSRQSSLLPLYTSPKNAPNFPMKNLFISSTPIKNVPIKHVPIKYVPIKHVPIKNVPIKNAPIKNITINNVPIKNAPIKNIPINNVPIKNVVVNMTPTTDFTNTEEIVQPPYPDHEYLSWKTREVNSTAPLANEVKSEGKEAPRKSLTVKKTIHKKILLPAKNQKSSPNKVQSNTVQSFLLNSAVLNSKNSALSVNANPKTTMEQNRFILIPQNNSSTVKVLQNKTSTATTKNLSQACFKKILIPRLKDSAQNKAERKLLPKVPPLIFTKPLPVLLVKTKDP